ncbi:hypothetical protein [Thioclava sp. DLFJ4-1]|uniref:hypothetical protein n=1 Tax=Thioclava sp. DLFJ4-1 TaxID=1915313 RepID=UPI000997DA51|nr:hypothetical protein [Thioclava sp. DLFJ4-1]OOY16850.1 hypothetical protein BMI85_07270 [Thioclava sp. DLFJ4-1]
METITACENVCRDFSWLPATIAFAADIATIVAVAFAVYQVRAWRTQQLAIKGQEFSSELLTFCHVLERKFDAVAMLPDRHEDAGSFFATWTPQSFIRSVLKQRALIAEIHATLDEVETLIRKLEALMGEEGYIDVTKYLRYSVLEYENSITSFMFSAGVYNALKGSEAQKERIEKASDELLAAARKLAPSQNGNSQRNFSRLRNIAESHLSLS